MCLQKTSRQFPPAIERRNAVGRRGFFRSFVTARAAALHGTPQALQAVFDAGAAPRLRAALVGGSFLDPEPRERAETAGIRVSAYLRGRGAMIRRER